MGLPKGYGEVGFDLAVGVDSRPDVIGTAADSSG